MKRNEHVIKELKADISTIEDYIKNFNHEPDWKIEKKVNEVTGFFEGYRFCLKHLDRGIIRTKDELAENHILNQTYPEFYELWEKFEEKFSELKKMMLLNNEDEAWYIAEDEKEKIRKQKTKNNS